ncbi:hypothetical protein HOU26_gp46 [Escherichia phage IMM-002]|uniref:Uncharacterized protein n=1 Tax=Escherichia phage IMM-002 TaxID=2041760 RepID=A0A384X1E9_9CAUD|nr:hypothetical protein HOU26_gp46 [Escherichia phage IMM-002]ATI17005.1 hypothetical protein [Escherichia phage IMM-002]
MEAVYESTTFGLSGSTYRSWRQVRLR